jgi:hypothetical protein
MMIVACSNIQECEAVYRVLGDWAEVQTLVGPRSEFWPQGYTCPKCNGPAQGAMETDIDPQVLAGFQIREIEAQEMYRAQYGMGLPEEMDCRREVIEQALRENPIRRISGHEVAGANRFVLEHLELWDGTKIHFGASTHGAIITRVVPPHSYVAKVSKEPVNG